MDTYSDKAVRSQRGKTTENIIESLLKECGVPMNIKGYTYLCEAIAMVLEEPDTIHALTKVIYPMIAKKHSTGSSAVERNIRTAVSLSYQRGDPHFLRNLFGPTDSSRCRPTNGEFIAASTVFIKRELLI